MITRATERWVVALTSIASLMVGLDILVVTTALDTIRLDLGASVGQLEWTVTAYNLSFAVLLMTASALGDRFGRRRLFVLGLAVFTLASAGCALAPSAGLLIAARAGQGVGAALVTPLGFALVSATVPAERRARALGIAGGVTGLATFAGPLIGGSVAQFLTWQWIFWVNVPIGVIAILLVRARVMESLGPRQSLDVRGLGLLTAAALGLLWGLIRASDAGWSNPQVAGSLLLGISLGTAFLAYERRAAHPLLPLALFRLPGFGVANIVTLLHSAVVLGSVFWMAQFLQSTLGYGPLGAGVRLLPWTGTLMIVAPVSGILCGRFGDRAMMVAGLATAAAGLGWLALVAAPGVGYAMVVGPLFVAGVGNSMVFPAVQNAVVASVPHDDIGRATGAHSMAQEFGGVFGIVVLAAVFTEAGGYATPASFTHGFVAAVIVCIVLSTIGAAVSTRLRPVTASAPVLV